MKMPPIRRTELHIVPGHWDGRTPLSENWVHPELVRTVCELIGCEQVCRRNGPYVLFAGEGWWPYFEDLYPVKSRRPADEAACRECGGRLPTLADRLLAIEPLVSIRRFTFTAPTWHLELYDLAEIPDLKMEAQT